MSLESVQKSMEWMETAQLLRVKARQIEADITKYYKPQSTLYETLNRAQLEDVYRSSLEEVVQDWKRLVSGVQRIGHEVEVIKGLLTNVELGDEWCHESCRTKYTRHKAYDEMNLEERALTSSIDMELADKLAYWESDDVVVDKKRTVMPTHSETSMPKEVVAFEEYLIENGGETGNWDEEDHRKFLKLRAAFKVGGYDQRSRQGRPLSLQVISSELPTQTPQTVRDHEHWYAVYMDLLEQKRQAIAMWKKLKEARNVTLDLLDEDQAVDKHVVVKSAEEREAERRALAEWKKKKQLEEQEHAELQRQEEAKKQQEQQELEEKQREMRTRVKEYKEKKLHEEQSLQREKLKLERESRRATALTDEDVASHWSRDRQIILNKQQVMQKRQEEEKQKEARLEAIRNQVRSKIIVKPDMDRLTAETVAQQRRRESTQQTRADPGLVMTGGSIPTYHTAMPSWRAMV